MNCHSHSEFARRRVATHYHALILICLIVPYTALPCHATSGKSNGSDIAPVGRETEISPFDNLAETYSGETDAGPIHRLSLSELISQVVARNYQLRIQKNEWHVKQSDEAGAHGIFEPDLVASAEHTDNSQKNTVEESLNRQYAGTYDEQNQQYGISVRGLVPTGGKYDIGYDLNRLSNSVTMSLVGEDEEYQMFFGARIRQPLLKNAGATATKAAIHTAEKESEASFQAYRQEMMAIVGDAATTYWECYRAQENLKLRADSVRIAETIQEDNKERHRAGKMAETEVLEAMAGLANRRALLIEAEQVRRDAENRLAMLLSIDLSRKRPRFEATDQPAVDTIVLDQDEIVQKAFLMRPEYLAARDRLEQAHIKLEFEKNQDRPELDLVASYGLNGTDFSASDSGDQILNADYDSWSLGLEFRLPLYGGIKTESELKAAELTVKSRLLAMKEIELNVTHSIDTAIHSVLSSEKQCQYADGVADIRKQLLVAETARLEAGKSNTRLILEKEDEYRNAREMALKNRVGLQKARIQLEWVNGTILLTNGVEIMEKK